MTSTYDRYCQEAHLVDEALREDAQLKILQAPLMKDWWHAGECRNSTSDPFVEMIVEHPSFNGKIVILIDGLRYDGVDLNTIHFLAHLAEGDGLLVKGTFHEEPVDGSIGFVLYDENPR